MLSLRTTHDWTLAVEVVAPSGGGAPATDTYVQTTACPSAYQTAAAFVAWANDAARPWTGTHTFTLSWRRVGTGGGGCYEVEVAGGWVDWTPDATAIDRLGWDIDSGSRIYAIQPASGVWAPAGIGLSGWNRHLQGDGEGSGVGAVRNGVAGLASRRPDFDAVATNTESALLTSHLASASVPRRGYVWDVIGQAWRLLSLGPVRVSTVDPLLQRVVIEVVG